MSKVDVEVVFTKAVASIKTKLNDAIAAINVEKGDFEIPPRSMSTLGSRIAWRKKSSTTIRACRFHRWYSAFDRNKAIRFQRTSWWSSISSSVGSDFFITKRILRYQRAFWRALPSLHGHNLSSWVLTEEGETLNPETSNFSIHSFYSQVIGIQIEFNLIN